MKDKKRCKCGKRLPYEISPYFTPEKRVCKRCGRVHYADLAPIDFEAAFGKGEENKQCT